VRGWQKGAKYNSRCRTGCPPTSRARHPGRLAIFPLMTIARLAAAALAAILTLWLPQVAFQGGGSVARAAASPDVKEAELKQVRNRIDSIRRAIHADAERRDALAGQVKEAELKIQSARERLSDVRAQRIAAENRLGDLEAEQVTTNKRIDSEREALGAELKVAYMNGHQEQLKLLLNQQDPARLGRMMAYYGYFGRARAERITAISEHLAHLELIAENIEQETQKLRELEQEQARDVKTLAGARDQRARTLAQVQSKIKNRNDELAKLQREAQALEKLVEELRRAIEEFPELAEQPFQRVKGKLPWPVKGSLLARFGQLRAGGPLKWQGIVIGADRGTQVRSPYYGRVVYADWLPGLGLLVVVDHGGGYMSLYGHNEQVYRRVGDRVSPGDALAAVGDAAGFGKPGLYFEIRKGRETLDPGAWLVKK
jgi:septal ring factor EnvC (AmiA/AmiB activator)